MSTAKNERLLNLLICLLSTRQFITADRIRRSVPAYGRDMTPKGQAAFERKFDRDKEELRELGVTIEVGTNSIFDTVPGYRITGRDATLPPIDLTARESAAVAIAAELWRTARFESATHGALLKLKAAGVQIDQQPVADVEPSQRAMHPAFEPLLAAVRDRTEVSFVYRATASTDRPTERVVQPWGLGSWKARWYVVGHDVERGATRVFRLSRIVGDVTIASESGAYDVPDDIDLLGLMRGLSHTPALRASVRVHDGEATALRRIAVDHSEDGRDLTIEVRDVFELAGLVASYGADVEVLEPPAAREHVIGWLTERAALTGGEG